MMFFLLTKTRRALALALPVLLLCAAVAPSVAASPALPADWQTVECGGLALSVPSEWSLGEAMGIRIASSNPSDGGPVANVTVLASILYVEEALWDEETYQADVSDGIAYNTARIESFRADPIGDWAAIRTVLTAEDATDTYLLYEAIVATGAEEGVRVSCVCNVSARDQLEETFAQIIASIRKPGENVAIGSPDPLTADTPSETPTFASDSLNLRFELPAGWIQVEATGQSVFLAPDGNGAILVVPSKTAVTQEMIAGFTEELLRGFVEEQGAGGFTNIQNLFFAKAVDADGHLYVLGAHGYMVGDMPFIYAQYHATAKDGTLVSVVVITTNDQAGGGTLTWLDEMTKANIPADVYAELGAQIGM